MNLLINDCLNIEYNIKKINIINENIKKCDSVKLKIKFYPENDKIINQKILILEK